MPDVIQLLPDSVANQIAAGEVVQRPASVVKELVENAIDAGSLQIIIKIIDGGRTLIQVVDDGKGMSETDARMSFERHATSKIRNADDLYCIHTMGFRGEALASIASVAQVTLKTRRQEDELGTEIIIQGSKVEDQRPIATSYGSNFQVKNLFFNVPARRKFLKNDSTEFRHILLEVQRIALCHPEVKFILTNNNSEIYNLPVENRRQRIVHLFGKTVNQNLATIQTQTSIVGISGFIGKPEATKKRAGDQFFFINGRFMRHPYFHRAVMNAYEQLIPAGTIPTYFIYFETEPETIDVNIHPTKTEIKFEDEQAIFQILYSSVKEGLGKFNLVPSIDFETSGLIDIPIPDKNADIQLPRIDINYDYNPFREEKKVTSPKSSKISLHKEETENWEKLYDGFQNETKKEQDQDFFGMQDEGNEDEKIPGNQFFQLKGKYILTSVKSGLMMIDQKRAHERVLFEQFLVSLIKKQPVMQGSLFPQTMELNEEQYSIWSEINDVLKIIGFEISEKDKVLTIARYPADIGENSPIVLLEDIFQTFHESPDNIGKASKETLALSMARVAAIPYGKILSSDEMRQLVDALFGTHMPNYSPSGKPIVSIMNEEELKERFT